MTTYQVADGHDNEAGFADIDPQPACQGVQVTRRTYNPDGTITDESQYVEFKFSMLSDVTEYRSILTQFGLLNSNTNEVTVKVRDDTYADDNLNGMAIRPQVGNWSNFFPRNVTILVKNLADT